MALGGALVFSGGLPGDAPAQTSLEAGLAASFDKADADGNGVLTREELAAQRDRRLRSLDQDGNGRISLPEFGAEEPPGLTEAGRQQWIDSRRLQFAQMDEDGDGWLTVKEFDASAWQGFAAADASKDGTVTRAELNGLIARYAAAMQRQTLLRQMARLDYNGDGHLDPMEFLTSRRGSFLAADKNGDGALSVAEFLPAASAAAETRRRERAERDFSRLDRNQDGVLVLAEFDQASRDLFSRLDRNRDGFLDGVELAAELKQR